MARKATKEIIPFMKALMADLGCETLSEFAVKTGIARSSVDEYAFAGRVPTSLNAVILSQKTGRSVEDIISGLSGKALAS